MTFQTKLSATEERASALEAAKSEAELQLKLQLEVSRSVSRLDENVTAKTASTVDGGGRGGQA